MIWYNPPMGTSCARGDASQRPVIERTVNPTVLCFVIFPPIRRCCWPTRRSCCTGPLRTDAVLRVLDPPTAPMTAAVCLYDNCQTLNVNATARFTTLLHSPGLFTPPGVAGFTPFSIKALQVILPNHENPHTFRAAISAATLER